MNAFTLDQTTLVRSLTGLAEELSVLARENANADAAIRLTNAAELVTWLAREAGGGIDTFRADVAKSTVKRLTVAEVTAYLRKRGTAQDSASDVRYLEGGFSKVTILVSANIGGRTQELVFRQEPYSRRLHLLPLEFDVLCKLYQAGLPVAEPLWLEMDVTQLGCAFFVSRRAPGHNIGDVWGASGVPEELCRELARFYARLHALDISRIAGVAGGRSTRAELLEMIKGWEELALRWGFGNDPKLQGIITWLREHIPDALPAPALTHGDAALSNILVLDGKISVILDWEHCHLGVPAEELAYLRPTIEPNLAWHEFLQEYAHAGGRVPDADSLRYFTVLANYWRYVGSLGLIKDFQKTGRYSSAIAGFVSGPRFLASAVAAMAGDAHA